MSIFSWNRSDRFDKSAEKKAIAFAKRHGIVIQDGECPISEVFVHADIEKHCKGNPRLHNLLCKIFSRHCGSRVNGISSIDGGVFGWWSK